MHFPIVALLKVSNFPFAFGEDYQRRRLHPAGGGHVEAAVP